LQAAARIAGKPNIFEAAEEGDLALVKDHCIVDAGCIHEKDKLPPSRLLQHSSCFQMRNDAFSFSSSFLYALVADTGSRLSIVLAKPPARLL